MENDPVHAKRLEDNVNRRNESANPETTDAVPSEGRTDARQDDLETPHESADTGELQAVRLKSMWTRE